MSCVNALRFFPSGQLSVSLVCVFSWGGGAGVVYVYETELIFTNNICEVEYSSKIRFGNENVE